MRSLLDIATLSKDEVSDIFSLASNYLIEKKDDVLLGKNIVLGFFESSTRTRISFDLARVEDSKNPMTMFFPSSISSFFSVR